MNTLTQLWDRLNKHDWYYQMSDDHRYYVAGEADWAELTTMAAAIPGGPELKSAFSAHYYTGEPWGNDKQPKPVRPVTADECDICLWPDGTWCERMDLEEHLNPPCAKSDDYEVLPFDSAAYLKFAVEEII